MSHIMKNISSLLVSLSQTLLTLAQQTENDTQTDGVDLEYPHARIEIILGEFVVKIPLGENITASQCRSRVVQNRHNESCIAPQITAHLNDGM